MSLEVRELGTEDDAALRGLLSVEALRNLRLLDAWEETSMGPSRHYGLFSAQRLLAAALVEPSSGRIWPSACAPEHAHALGTSPLRRPVPGGPSGSGALVGSPGSGRSRRPASGRTTLCLRGDPIRNLRRKRDSLGPTRGRETSCRSSGGQERAGWGKHWDHHSASCASRPGAAQTFVD